jgi:solute:Na+ symporter, SSS family
MTALDWCIVAAYFGILLVVVWWATVKNRTTTADYFLAGRGLGWTTRFSR